MHDDVFCMTSLVMISLSFFLAKEISVRNVVNVLHEAMFADGDWAKLGLQLIDHFDSTTIRADHGQAILCMIETISQWLKTDREASWEKLAEAVTKVVGCGNATADIIWQKAGRIHTCMFFLMNVFCEVQFHKEKLFIFLTVASEATLSPHGVSSQLPLTSKVDKHGEP